MPHDSSAISSAAQKIIGWLIAALLLVSILSCLAVDIQRRFITQAPEKILNNYVVWDGNISKAVGSGGLFLRFVNFHGLSRGYTTNVYYRAVYLLYPQPVLVADPSVPIDDAIDIDNANSDHSDRWMRRHGIDRILTVDGHNGPPQVQSLRRLDPIPPSTAIPG